MTLSENTAEIGKVLNIQETKLEVCITMAGDVKLHDISTGGVLKISGKDWDMIVNVINDLRVSISETYGRN